MTRLLPLLRLLLYLLFPSPITFLRNSWRHSWSQLKLRTGSKQSLKNNHLRLNPRRPIQENFTWIAITFISNVRTISKLQAPPGWTVPHLQPHSSVALLASDGLNTSVTTRTPLQLCGQNSKGFSERISRIFKLSLITSGVNLEGTSSTSWKGPETGYHTSSTSNPFWQNSIVLGP